MNARLGGVLTDEQRAAVEARGNVLLMAGAGTGKTSTLVARVLADACHPTHPVSLDRILMVTFTEAAAAEMRHRLRQRLEEQLQAAPEDHWLAEQLVRIDTAPIGTLHGFCLRLIREHFQELGLDPQLRVLDTAESGQLFQESLENVFEPLLSGELEEGRAAARWLSAMHNGDLPGAFSLVRRLHELMRSRHDSEAWLARAIAHWNEANPEAWVQSLREALPVWAAEWRRELASLLPAHARAQACDAALEAVQTAVAGADPAWRQDAATHLEALTNIGPKPVKRGPNADDRPALPSHLTRILEEADFLRGIVQMGPGGEDPLAVDWRATRPHIEVLLQLLQRVATDYAARKRELGTLDFSDLEQFALRLLGDGTTATAQMARARFECVLVDEAQDLNPAQSAILQAVSRDGSSANRFLVGDVKQSIYRFRLADPGIFQGLAHQWSGGAQGTTDVKAGRVLPLTANFRSHEGILAFVNQVFPQWMQEALGGVAYDASATLHFGAREQRAYFACDGTPRVEVILRTTRVGEEDAEETVPDENGLEEASEAEARIVAARLLELQQSATPVWDGRQRRFRPMEWSDVVVLLRAPGPRGGVLARAFRAAGIPLSTPPGPLHEQPEVRDLVSLLQILDNPLQDIPLAAVLRSPLGGIPLVTELAVIRMASRDGVFWTALGHFHALGTLSGWRAPDADEEQPLLPTDSSEGSSGDEDGPSPTSVRQFQSVALHRPVWIKVDGFLRHYHAWRTLAQRGSMAALVESILDDTGYEATLQASEHPEQGRANIRALLELARRFDGMLRGGLMRFLRFLSDHAASGAEAPVVAGQHAVRLMSIHASKGLEFPITVVAGLGGRFNLRDLQANVVLSHDGEIGPVVVTASGDRYPSWPMWRAVGDVRRALIGEELRLFYVAMTRACDRLLLVGSANAASVERWASETGPLTPAWMCAAQSALQWLVPVLVRECSENAVALGSSGSTPLVSWRTLTSGSDRIPESKTQPVPAPVLPAPEVEAPAPIAAPLQEGWVYASDAATRESAKQSVTALRRRAAEAEDESVKRFRGAEGRFRIRVDGAAPDSGDLDAAMRGTLQHRFQEHVCLTRTGSRAELEAELARLVAEGRFDAREASAVDLEALERFWASEVGTAMRAQPEAVRREIPFTLRLSPPDMDALGLPHAPGLGADEFVVVQGVIDIAFRLPGGGCWIGDFKTDRVTEESLPEKARQYGPQLRLYALALERIYKWNAERCWLYFLALGRTVDVPVVSR